MEISATVMMYKDGLAICEDGYGTLWYTEIPEEIAEVGSAIGLEDLQELSELPLPLQKIIMEELDNMPKELTDELLGLESCKQKSSPEMKKAQQFSQSKNGYSKADRRRIPSPTWIE